MKVKRCNLYMDPRVELDRELTDPQKERAINDILMRRRGRPLDVSWDGLPENTERSVGGEG